MKITLPQLTSQDNSFGTDLLLQYESSLPAKVEHLPVTEVIQILVHLAMRLRQSSYGPTFIAKLLNRVMEEPESLTPVDILFLSRICKELRYCHAGILEMISNRQNMPGDLLQQNPSLMINSLPTWLILNLVQPTIDMMRHIQEARIANTMNPSNKIGCAYVMAKLNCQEFDMFALQMIEDVYQQRAHLDQNNLKRLYFLLNQIEHDRPGMLSPTVLNWSQTLPYSSSQSTSHFEHSTINLLNNIFGEVGVEHYRLGPFEYDLHYPKMQAVVEVMGPLHYL